MRSHLSVHGRKGPEAAGAPREGRRPSRDRSPRGLAESAQDKGPGPAGFGGRGADESGAGRKRGGDTSERRRRGEERGGRRGHAAAQPGRAHGARSLRLAAAASRRLPPGSLPRQPRGSGSCRPGTQAPAGAGPPSAASPCPAPPGCAAWPAPRAPRRPPPALSSPPPAPRSPPDWLPGRALLPPRPRGSAAPSARCWQARAGPALREGAFKATHTPPRTERLAGSSNPGDGEMS